MGLPTDPPINPWTPHCYDLFSTSKVYPTEIDPTPGSLVRELLYSSDAARSTVLTLVNFYKTFITKPALNHEHRPTIPGVRQPPLARAHLCFLCCTTPKSLRAVVLCVTCLSGCPHPPPPPRASDPCAARLFLENRGRTCAITHRAATPTWGA